MLGILVHIASFVFQAQGKGGCRDLVFLHCVQNKTLTGHVISTVSKPIPALQHCQYECFFEGQCLSYNLGPTRGNIRACELNAADHSTRPRFLVSKVGYEYCAMRNPCLSKPCPDHRLCTPDLSWDTFNCDDGGWTQWSSWTGCFLPSVCKPKRTRSCTSPAPNKRGAYCAGPAVKTRKWVPGECTLPQINTNGCQKPLGMEDGRIKNRQITASSYLITSIKKNGYAAWRGRLNEKMSPTSGGGWVPVAMRWMGEYIQIDLGSIKVITKVATQGRSARLSTQFVTKYSLAYSNNTRKWLTYEGDCTKIFLGNRNKDTVVTNKLEVPITARHLRLIVKGIFRRAAIRMEIYGCSSMRSTG